MKKREGLSGVTSGPVGRNPTGPRRPPWLPCALVASTGPSFACRALARPAQDQPPGLSRLLPLRLSVAARSVRGRLRLLDGAGRAASGCPASSSAGSRAHVPSSQRFNAWDASKGTSPLPFAASSKTALASAVRWRNSSAAADTRTSIRGCVNNTASASRPASPLARSCMNAAIAFFSVFVSDLRVPPPDLPQFEPVHDRRTPQRASRNLSPYPGPDIIDRQQTKLALSLVGLSR